MRNSGRRGSLLGEERPMGGSCRLPGVPVACSCESRVSEGSTRFGAGSPRCGAGSTGCGAGSPCCGAGSGRCSSVPTHSGSGSTRCSFESARWGVFMVLVLTMSCWADSGNSRLMLNGWASPAGLRGRLGALSLGPRSYGRRLWEGSARFGNSPALTLALALSRRVDSGNWSPLLNEEPTAPGPCRLLAIPCPLARSIIGWVASALSGPLVAMVVPQTGTRALNTDPNLSSAVMGSGFRLTPGPNRARATARAFGAGSNLSNRRLGFSTGCASPLTGADCEGFIARALAALSCGSSPSAAGRISPVVGAGRERLAARSFAARSCGSSPLSETLGASCWVAQLGSVE